LSFLSLHFVSTVSSNQLTGGFPGEFGLMSNLEYFFASANTFAEEIIPAFLASLPNLREIGLKSANRYGNIPPWLGGLKNLTLLDLDDNNLFGPLPTQLGLLTKLQFLLLNRNDLSGGIPDEYDSLTSLRMGFFDKNKLNGTMARRLPAGCLVSSAGGSSPPIVLPVLRSRRFNALLLTCPMAIQIATSI
jgi:Leucine-rich repeat (LRR) protein